MKKLQIIFFGVIALSQTVCAGPVLDKLLVLEICVNQYVSGKTDSQLLQAVVQHGNLQEIQFFLKHNLGNIRDVNQRDLGLVNIAKESQNRRAVSCLEFERNARGKPQRFDKKYRY